MVARRILIIGNSGSGKTTYAAELARREHLQHVDLDPYGWLPSDPPRRRPVEDAMRSLRAELPADGWVVEGCYADLLQHLSPQADRLIFLNPGVEACIRNCRARPFEPHKYETPEAQDANLPMLLEWVRGYDTREGPLGLAAHRELFEEFGGDKQMLTAPAVWPDEPLEDGEARCVASIADEVDPTT